MWEIFTYCQEQPLADLNEDQVCDNLKHWFHSDGFGLTPRRPTLHQCTKEMFDLIRQCWSREPEERPLFMEIHQFLQNKCLGFSVDWNPPRHPINLFLFKPLYHSFLFTIICDKLVNFPILWMCSPHVCLVSPIKIKKKVSFWPIVVKKVFSGGCWLPLVTLRVRKWTIPSCGLTFSKRG